MWKNESSDFTSIRDRFGSIIINKIGGESVFLKASDKDSEGCSDYAHGKGYVEVETFDLNGISEGFQKYEIKW